MIFQYKFSKWEPRLKWFNVADRLKRKIYEQQNSPDVENVDSYGKTTTLYNYCDIHTIRHLYTQCTPGYITEYATVVWWRILSDIIIIITNNKYT